MVGRITADEGNGLDWRVQVDLAERGGAVRPREASASGGHRQMLGRDDGLTLAGSPNHTPRFETVSGAHFKQFENDCVFSASFQVSAAR
jgi:hypothetical protein